MAIYNLGSINIDLVYQVPHLPKPGETLSALTFSQGLGGKGANQSVAAARAGAMCYHIGAVGPGSDWLLASMAEYGVDTGSITRLTEPTGHAVINVDPEAENSIVIYPGANRMMTAELVTVALGQAVAGDSLLLQNETSAQVEAAALANARGLRVVYSAAPFDLQAVRAVLDHVSLLVMNEGEAAELHAAFGSLPSVDCIITRGAEGAEWISACAEPLFMPSFRVEPVDTTGAGDTFIGTLTAALDLGMDRAEAMRRAAAAAAIQVTRTGAAQAIPTAAEVTAFLTNLGT